MTYKYSYDQPNQSYDLHYDLQGLYDWPTVSFLLLSTESRRRSFDEQAQLLTYILQR